MPHVVSNVACTQCGCVCDDMRVVVEGERILDVGPACSLAQPWFVAQNGSDEPTVTIAGRAASLDEGLTRAAAILGQARAPLIYGLSRSSTEGQRAAVALADRIGATIDTTASLCHAPSIMGFQETGESTSSLGEIRNRSDLVIFWGCDPAVSHPRHWERYSVEPVGEFVAGGRSGRTIVVVDHQPTDSSAESDLFIRIEGDCDFEALWALRQMIRCDAPAGVPSGGLPLSDLRDLARRMTTCRSGVVFFGLGLSRAGLGHLNVTALLRLVEELQRHTRFYARRLRVYGDVTGADSVLCWQTGYPFSVNLGRGYPRYSPGEFSAEDLLAREEVDACLLVGSETVTQFSGAARNHLRRIPTIVLDNPGVAAPFTPDVAVTTAIYGVHRPGTAYRMDEIPIPLKGFLASRLPSDNEILRSIEERLTA